jgi:hypothetical protein
VKSVELKILIKKGEGNFVRVLRREDVQGEQEYSSILSYLGQ